MQKTANLCIWLNSKTLLVILLTLGTNIVPIFPLLEFFLKWYVHFRSPLTVLSIFFYLHIEKNSTSDFLADILLLGFPECDLSLINNLYKYIIYDFIYHFHNIKYVFESKKCIDYVWAHSLFLLKKWASQSFWKGFVVGRGGIFFKVYFFPFAFSILELWLFTNNTIWRNKVGAIFICRRPPNDILCIVLSSGYYYKLIVSWYFHAVVCSWFSRW